MDQIFIDNLFGYKGITLDFIAKNGIKAILDNKNLVDKKEIFDKALKAYYNNYIK